MRNIVHCNEGKGSGVVVVVGGGCGGVGVVEGLGRVWSFAGA